MSRGVLLRSLCAAAAVTLSLVGPLRAQRVPFGWENSTELSYVSTGGNASSSSFGMKASLIGTDSVNTVKLEVGGLRAETDVTTRTAVGTPTAFDVTKTKVSQVTAENYFMRGRYDRDLEHAFAFAGAGWARNTFAGVQNRVQAVAGLGRTLINAGDAGHLKADLGGTYTVQKDVDPVAGADDSFGGIRVSVDIARRISESADYQSDLIVDENLEETDDMRADWLHSVTLAINERLAFKTSVQVLYDHKPSNLRVPLVDGGGAPTGTTVLTPGDRVDHVTTLTLVIRL